MLEFFSITSSKKIVFKSIFVLVFQEQSCALEYVKQANPSAILVFSPYLKFFLSSRKYVQRAWYTKTNRIDGRVVIITGCNTGLGKAAAIEIAKRGAKLYLACRDMKKCEEVRKEIIALSSNPSVYARELDLGSLESIRKFSERFHKEENKLDILMNNAGIFMVPQAKTKDGFEQVMGVNHLGHFLLTNLLLDLLKVC
jgi:short chain dehydrogenase